MSIRGCGEGGVEFKAMGTKVHSDPCFSVFAGGRSRSHFVRRPNVDWHRASATSVKLAI
jgi:hypothetical protein